MATGSVIIRKKEDSIAATVRRIIEMLGELRFGSITVVVQEGKVLQIDKTEKFRIGPGR
ncbi:YezD family protein [Geomesophilobacter sediminis]|uniref:YezD family protein n=1 Tax=Geomesophilobacter sediminis TaxID=2798584 RepID=A0A8J7LTS2_9BACT|nr:YezD family protein [Geomesophilobacter sediminis]MBJ6723749.1 YezD family protein [Geomesophilobacter sediminis]